MEIHNQWRRWSQSMDEKMKYDVCLYQMKHVYETKLMVNESNELQDPLVGNLDLLLSRIYYYDGNISDNDKNKTIRDDICNPDSEKKVLKQLEQQTDHTIRVGFFRNNTYRQSKRYFLLSTNHDEDPSLYVKMTNILLSDEIETRLYYMIRYNLSIDLYYALHADMLSDTDDTDLLQQANLTLSPAKIDEIDDIRFYAEYLEGVDIDFLYEKIKEYSTLGSLHYQIAFDTDFSYYVFKALTTYPQFFTTSK